MSVAKELVEVDPFFIQECPLCSRKNRVVVKGVYKLGDKVELHPDMGYSFCNCMSIFYTRKENVLTPGSYEPDENGIITLPDPFFAWPDPYQFHLWDVRKWEVIWDLDSFCDYLAQKGYKVLFSERIFDVNSPTPQCFRVKVEKI